MATAGDYHFPIDTIEQTLRYIGIDTSDISFRTDWVDRDSFRLATVDYYTQHLLQIPNYLKSRGDFLKDSSVTILEKFDSLAMTLNSTWMPIDFNQKPTIPENSRVKGFESIPPSSNVKIEQLRKKISILVDRMTQSDGYHDFQNLDPAGLAFVKDSYTAFLREEEKDVNRPLDELDSIQKLQDSLANRFKDILPKINCGVIVARSRNVVEAYMDLVEWLKSNRKLLATISDEDIKRYFPEQNSAAFRIAVGGRGNDRYVGSYDIIIDLGGDDEYLLSSSDSVPNQIIIDLSGNDRYIAQSNFAFGAGHFGCGILDDWSGNDIYIAKNYSLGCGIFGAGILIDRGGDDTYQGDICCEAASSFGVGVLLDYGGRDSYQSSLYSQGFAFIMGSSALVDYSGNDQYTCGWKYGDILRYEDHYLSMAQGFGFGYRPYFSGGVGLLVDGAGNDVYSADIFAQGASYWFALGGLLDYGGNDQYISYQYAQGAATHLTLAALIDLNGDDLYSSKGVSQGCGHDLAFGLLLDCAGNDQYNAFDLSQAAGSANGIGMLIDLKGNDGYMARVKGNTHGYGNPRREFGSIGLFLDLDGKDDYKGYGADDSYWVTQSKWGIGADLNSVKPDSTKKNAK